MGASQAAVMIILKARDDATKTLKSLGKSATALGKTLTAGLTLPLVGIGIAAVKMASDMDREMKNIQSISKATDAEIAALSQTFVDMSTDLTVTTDSAVKLAEGFYTIQGSGFAGADAMAVLEAATRAASAGLTDTEVAAKAITAGLNAYGESADQAASFSDLMFRTVDIGVGTFEELSSSLGYVVGTASQAGVGFDEVSAALSTMSKQGIEFHKGGRALNMLLLQLIQGTDGLIGPLMELGFTSGQAALDALGLAGTLQALEEAGYGGTEGFASLGLSSMSLRAALALTGTGAEMFTGDLEAMQTASEGVGAAQEAFAIQTESFSAQMANFKNIVWEAGIMLGNTLLPALTDLLKRVKPLIQRFSEMDENTRKWVLVIAGVTAAVGPALIILGKIATVIGVLAPAFSAMAGGVSLAVTAVGVLTGASTMLGAALLTIAPLAVIAGLALLAKKVYDNIQAHKDLAAEAIHTSSTYTEYRKAVEDSDRWTTTLSEDVWKLVDAKIELQDVTGEAAAALAAEGIEQQKLLDTLKQYQQGSQEVVGVLSEFALNTSGVSAAEAERTRGLILQDAALRDVAVAQGILTQAQVDAVEALESSDRAMLTSIAGHQARAQAIEEAEQRVEDAIIQTELAARQTAQSMDIAMQDSAEAIRSVEPPIEDMMTAMKKLARDESAREHADAIRAMADAVNEALQDATISYAAFFGDISEGIEEHKAKLIEIEETSAADIDAARTKHLDNLFEMQRTHDHNLAEVLETHAGKLQTLQTQHDQAETDAQREQIDARIEAEQASWTERQSDLDYALSEKQRKENEAYAEGETKHEEHLAAKLAKEEEAYAELQKTQRKQLGEMLMQQVDTWARVDDTVAEHALSMKLVIAEEFGIITETGRQQGEDMLGFMEEWVAGGVEMTDEMIIKFQEYMDKAQDGVTATEDFGAAVDSVPEIDIRHNLEEVEDRANRATSAVNSIPSHKNVKVNFERTGWSGVQEMSPKTRIQHMLEDLDTFLQRTDFAVRFGAEGLADIGGAQEVGEQISTDLVDGMTKMERLNELTDAGSLLAAMALDSTQKTLGPGMDSVGETLTQDMASVMVSVGKIIEDTCPDNTRIIEQCMISADEAVSRGMVSISETLKQDTDDLHRQLSRAWDNYPKLIQQDVVLADEIVRTGMVSISETLKQDTDDLHRQLSRAWDNYPKLIQQDMVLADEVVRVGMFSMSETLRQDTDDLHHQLNRAWASLASSVADSIASINATVARGTVSVGASVSGYQFGGVVPGPIGRPQLAVVHGGERITPTGRGGARGGIHIEIHNLYGTSREVAEETARYLAAQLRREGIA